MKRVVIGQREALCDAGIVLRTELALRPLDVIGWIRACLIRRAAELDCRELAALEQTETETGYPLVVARFERVDRVWLSGHYTFLDYVARVELCGDRECLDREAALINAALRSATPDFSGGDVVALDRLWE